MLIHWTKLERSSNSPRERIRQIEKEALKKLASSELGELLRSFLE
jgi:DNA-directed RNA polymerase sigma subunit (sigma70/sigma32)